MNILKMLKWWFVDQFMLYGGDGGNGGTPTSSTAYNTNVPAYAQPYVENMLDATQSQIFNNDMSSFRPYNPYSNNVNNYFAGFSPMQQQAQFETANLRSPEQFGVASGLTGLGGMGSLAAGTNYASNVTNPASMQSYMNPYQQGVTDVTKNAAVREAMIAENANRLSSARQGTYGGARQLLGTTERERNLLSNLSNIQAQGSNNAYNQAIQSQQFGSNLGLQGFGQAVQAGGQMANIGTQEQSTDLARLNAQNAMGGQQQALEQNKVNQAISNYATAQQYPFMQLGIMNSMLRGLPLQQTTTSTYQQQPSSLQQIAGLGGAALSYMGKKEGGVIGMKKGGTVPGYKYGDLISDPQLQSMSQNLSPDQLQARIKDPQVNNNERDIFASTQQAQKRLANNPMAAQQMAQALAPPQQMQQDPTTQNRMGGIAQAGGNMFNTMGYAGGGIVAFSGQEDSLVADAIAKAEKEKTEQDAVNKASVAKKAPPKAEAKPKEIPLAGREAYLAETQKLIGQQNPVSPEEQAYASMLSKQQEGLGEVTAAKERANMAKAFLKAGANPRGFLAGAIEGGESYLTGAGEIAASKEARETTLAKSKAEYASGVRARAAGDVESASKHFDEAEKLKNTLQIAQGNNATTIRAAEIAAASHGVAGKQEEAKVEAYMKDHPGATRSEAYAAVAQYARGDTNEIARQRYADAALADNLEYLKLSTSKKPEDQAKAQEIKNRVYTQYGVASAGAKPPVVTTSPVQNNDGTITIPGKGTFKKLPNGNYAFV